MNSIKKILNGLWRIIQPPRKISFTREGLIFTLLSFPVGLAAINTGNNMLYLVLGMLLSIITMSGFLSESTLKKVKIFSRLPRCIGAGTDLITFANVENQKRFFPSYLLRVAHLWEKKGEEKEPRTKDGFLIKVEVGEKLKSRLVSRFSQRGIYQLKGFRLATRFPFGLFDKSREINSPQKITVYPKPLPFFSEVLGTGAFHGEEETNIRGSGWDLYALRKYLPGDDARHIHWKISAKLGRPILREFTISGQKKIVIFFNTNIEKSPFFKNVFERSVSHVAYLVKQCLEEDREVGLFTPSVSFPPERGESQFHKIMNFLATVNPQTKSSNKDFYSSENVSRHFDAHEDFSFIQVDPNRRWVQK